MASSGNDKYGNREMENCYSDACIRIACKFCSVLLPKTGPTWADPVPFIQGVTGQDGSGNGQKSVGYSQDDSQLGGPFQGDNTLIFTASSRDRHYWRIETKDTYTSKGWIVSEGTLGKTFMSQTHRF